MIWKPLIKVIGFTVMLVVCEFIVKFTKAKLKTNPVYQELEKTSS